MSKNRKYAQDSQGRCPNCDSEDIHWLNEFVGERQGICKKCRCEITENFHTEYLDTDYNPEPEGKDNIIYWGSWDYCPECDSDNLEDDTEISPLLEKEDCIKCLDCGCEFTVHWRPEYQYTEITKRGNHVK